MPELGLFHHPTVAATEAALAECCPVDSAAAALPLFEVLRSSLVRFDSSHHGDFDRWHTAIRQMPKLTTQRKSYVDKVQIQGSCDASARDQLKQCLLTLRPWRKGPFELFDINIDSEWRSDWKWQRLASELPDLQGEKVLDVGCGNGYFGWRLLEAGAAAVLGIDPTLLFCMQHLAINQLAQDDRNWVLPLRLEDLPSNAGDSLGFDGALSMGVIYHRRDPADHLQRLYRSLRPGGWLVLETLVVSAAEPLFPGKDGGRYARMRNVWCVPTLALLKDWLLAAGFEDVQVIHHGETSTREQRRTDWMVFESLAEALDPHDPTLTAEGWPRPRRAMLLARSSS
ncbi:MAG: tRNA 5-methoxyuridine(34)/uridine 5-oxyacetic acid(34) synthase CmoB [Pseudomonadales bacterium]